MRLFLMTILALLAWAALVVTGTIGGWWRAPLAAHGNTEAFRDAAIVEINRTYKGNVAFVLLERGQVYKQYHLLHVLRPLHYRVLYLFLATLLVVLVISCQDGIYHVA